MVKLPIDEHLPRVGEALTKAPCLVVQASPGSGKTTRVPPYLLSKTKGQVIVLEPRRLAAKLSAYRVADEAGEKIGQSIGYRFRMESQGGPSTRLWFLTEGMLMRQLLRDPNLAKVDIVLLDEFHERHLHTDLALAYLLHLQRTKRPDLKLVVMSATLDAKKISAHLNDCPVLSVEAKLYPVTQEYLDGKTVKDAVKKHLSREGDMLVFLPGMSEIRRAESDLRGLPNLDVFILHGDLSREEQERALGQNPRRKVILSTNIAETSLTLPGITTVIDSGLHRQAAHSWWSGVPTLKTKKISKASAEQRAGRAGRTAAGHCVRLYSQFDLETRPSFDLPELLRADLAQTVLELFSLGVSDLPWLEAPPPNAVQAALQLLSALSAVDNGKITEIGRRMAEIPAHPRLARMLIEAEKRNVLYDAATLAALISEGELDRLDALSVGAPPWLDRSRNHLLNAFDKPQRRSDKESLARSVLAGFPDRVARRRMGQSLRVKQHQTEVLLASGGAAIIEGGEVFGDTEWFVALDVQERHDKLRVQSMVAIEQDWLWELDLEERTEAVWDAEKGRAKGSRTIKLGQLVLEEKEVPAPPEEVGKLLLQKGLGITSTKLTLNDWIAALRPVIDPEELEQLVARVVLITSEDKVAEYLAQSFQSVESLKELKERDWATIFPDRHKLDSLLPEKITLPSGRSTKIFYRLGKTPWVESRLQDFFGMTQGPSVLGGKLLLTLHLLAPNKRAVQVTTDLAGFWERAYPTIRKELSRKYPRHSWPENPRQSLPRT